ncbi:MAG TPA: LysR family transcriptional regulator [Burkholderiales bacterium]|nr:LysR family transcriptional regulator [Burkholderiales bacterium]
MNLTLRQLRAFVAVARLGGFTAAAKRLHLTQSALSGLVKDLESGLGVRLFDRSTREVVPTQAGREFLPLAVRVLDDIRDAAVRISDIASSNVGIVRVAALEISSCTLLPPVIAAFQDQNRRLEVRLEDTVLEQVLTRVRLGEVDIGIGPEPAPDPELERTPLLAAPFMLACPTGHPLAKKKRVTWSELRGERFITMIRNFRSQFMTDLHGWPADLEFAPMRQTALATTALGMVQAGLGVTVCPVYAESLVRAFGLVLRPLSEPVVTADLFVFTKKGRSLSPVAVRFVAFLREELRRRHPELVP